MDNSTSFKQLEELISNVNWPLVSLSQLMKISCRPQGCLKQFNLIRKRVYQEIIWREKNVEQKSREREINLRHCQQALVQSGVSYKIMQ